MAIPPRPARPDPPPAPSPDREWPLESFADPGTRVRPGSAGARALWIVAGVALVAGAAFSIGEVRGARHHATNGSAPVVSSSPLSGLSISGLQNLQSQVSQAAALAQAAGNSGLDNGGSADLSQLEQQLGISPGASTSDQAAQLQAELNAINACLSGSSTAPTTGC